MVSEDYIQGVKDTIKKLYLVLSMSSQQIINSVLDEPQTIEEVLKET